VDEDEAAMTGQATTGSVHLGRPSLTVAGDKLQADWMRRFISGELPYKPRPEAQGRMPAFPTHGRGLADGMAHQHGWSEAARSLVRPDARLAEIGRRLTLVNDGFGCISCHDVLEEKALAGADTATINFAFVTDRLHESYYWRYVQDPQRFRPGTMMPNFITEDGKTPLKSVFDGDARRQFAAVWNYLLTLHAQWRAATNRTGQSEPAP
jgi:hypothetical protein